MMQNTIVVSKLSDFYDLKIELSSRWLDLMENSTAFRYKLGVRKQKILNGHFKFVLQLNSERSTLRRKPQIITSIQQSFNENVFNFNQVQPCEIIFDCLDHINGDTIYDNMSFLINNSPLTKYHSLICPNVSKNLPQILSKNSIRFIIDVILGFNDRKYRIGFNSLGAFASVNHLHFHLIWIAENLYIETAQTEHVVKNVYKLSENHPATALCLPLLDHDKKEEFSTDLFQITEYFCMKSIPHNIIWTLCPSSRQNILKAFIFPRNTMSDKHLSEFNVAFCELSGFVSVGSDEIYDMLMEDIIVDNIKNEMGQFDDDQLIADLKELFIS